VETGHTQSAVERAYAFVEDIFGLEHETSEHIETVVYKGVAYVKDILVLLADGEVTQVVRRPIPERDLTSDDALRLDDPHAYIFNQIVERSRHSCEK
jgi:hypothetical protein